MSKRPIRNASEVGRRRFLQGAAALAVPCIVPSWVLGGEGPTAPSQRITVGLIGHGAMGHGHLLRLATDPAVQLLAVCDVDRPRREEAQRRVEEIYSDGRAAGTYHGCAAYNDYRELLARSDIDAVVIATPDHWHTKQAIDAAKAGKDIYCEKPVSVTIGEGRRLVETVRRYGRVFQTGTQYRSIPKIRAVCEFVRAGGLGRIKSVFTTLAEFGVDGRAFSALRQTHGFRKDRRLLCARERLSARRTGAGRLGLGLVGGAGAVAAIPSALPHEPVSRRGAVVVCRILRHGFVDLVPFARRGRDPIRLGDGEYRAGGDHPSRQRPVPDADLPLWQRGIAASRGGLEAGDRPLQSRPCRGPAERPFWRRVRGRAGLADVDDGRRGNGTTRGPAGTTLPRNEAQEPRGVHGQWASRQLVRLHPQADRAQRVRGVGPSSGVARPPGDHRDTNCGGR